MSGGRWMGFYWKDGKDQVSVAPSPVSDVTIPTFSELFVRRGDLPNRTSDPWTTFEMDPRVPTPIPPAFDFIRFLVSSITFMVHLREVSVYFDDKRLIHLVKDVTIPKQLAIPQGLNPTSPMRFMDIKGLRSTRMWYIDNQARSVLTIVTRRSPAHYRGSHELGL